MTTGSWGGGGERGGRLGVGEVVWRAPVPLPTPAWVRYGLEFYLPRRRQLSCPPFVPVLGPFSRSFRFSHHPGAYPVRPIRARRRHIFTQELGRGHHEDISNSNNVNSEVLEEKLIPLLLGEIGPDSLQVDEDGEILQVGDMMKRSGGRGGQAVHLRFASTGDSSFCRRHTGWNSELRL